MKRVFLWLSVSTWVFAEYLFGGTPLGVGVNDFEYVGSNLDATVSDRVLVEGNLRKVGGGTLTLPSAKISSLAGTIGVFDGALATACDGSYELAEKPATLLQKAAFWVDASTNVVTFVSNDVVYVRQWLDAREPSPDGPYQYYRAVSKNTYTNEFPVRVAVGAGVGSALPYVWFGNYHSGRWMAWQNAASNAVEISNIRSVFVVHGSFTSYGTILGSGNADFLAGTTGGTGLNGPIWYTGSHSMMAATKTGRTFLDRQCVDGMTVYPKQGYQLLEVAGGEGGTSKAGNFFNERDLWAGFDYRVGGDRLCEVLIYTNRLSEVERLQVEQYLWQKWFSTAQDSSRFSLAAKASLSAETDAGITQSVGISGNGDLVKSGAGTLVVALATNTPSFNGSTTLASGAIDARVPFALQPAGGVVYASASNVLTASATNAGQIVKTGGGELVLRRVPDGVGRLIVSEGVLQFAQSIAPEACPTNPVGVIPNSRFEDYVFSGNAASVLQSGTAGWTSGANGRVWLFKDNVQTNGSFDWIRPYTAPEGRTVLGLQREAIAETTLTLPADGVYALSFWAAARTTGTASNGVTVSYGTVGGHEFDLSVDATQRVATVQTLSPDFQRFRYKLPWLPAGVHTLRFASLAPTLDYTSLLDDLRADFLTADQPLNVLTNADFECAGFMNKATEMVAPSNTTWTFTTSVVGSNFVGIANAGSVYSAWPDYGRRVLYIENQGVAATTMTFPEAGTYQLVFNIMHRRTVSTESTSSQQVIVSVNGTAVSTLSTTAQNVFSRVATSPFTVAANTPVTLTLAGQTTNNRVQLIDDITALRVGDGNLIQNGSFESDTNGWVCSGVNIGVETTTNANYGIVLFDGACRARVVFSGVIKQTVAFAEAGVYRLTFHAISRVDRNGGIPSTSYGLNPIAAWIGRNGQTNTLGYVKTYDEIFRRHEFLFPVSEAGSYEIGFQGQSATDKTSLIDAVSVEKVALSELGTVIPRATQLDVAAGARLNLNYVGTVPVTTVSYNGRILVGTLNSQTHPEFVSGAGEIYSSPKGTLIRVQ
jgi:hypothetical protein